MIWKYNYINLYLSIRKTLNSKNVEKLSFDQIFHIGKMHKNDCFNHYKKQVFLKWFSENTENTIGFLKRVNKLLKKLELILSEKEKQKINNIEPREFTQRRSMKTVEVPYKRLDDTNSLMSNAFFFYKGIRVYEKEIILFKMKYYGEIYITSKEIVIYDRKKDEIKQIIKYKNITSIKLNSYCIEIKLRNKKNIFLRYKDNELIYISLNRLTTIKSTIKFNNVSKIKSGMIEKIIEKILNI
ncbi:MAG: hypothetical protein HRS50_00530 [Mycoplasmataceae bacterium]|nr:hypothetical protein [Mycoplasmataceae bacterium]